MSQLRILKKSISCAAIGILVFSAMGAPIPGKINALPANAATTPYVLDAANHIITVSPNVTDVTSAVSSALNYLVQRPDKSTRWKLKFTGGKYSLTRAVRADNLQNVDLVSDRSNPAVFVKASGNPSEYLLYFRFAKSISMAGFTFYGKTSFATNVDPVWPDQGVYFGSCDGVKVDWNKFYNFGNAALRVTTDNYDPVQGVHSFNTTVTNNIFNNIYQISTTSNDDIHGATANYLFQYNTVANLRGAVKFASRTEGAKNVRVLYNIFNGGDHYGLEVNNFTDFYISSNTFQNIKSVAVNAYTNERASTTGFPWGNNFSIVKNKIINCGRGIRFSPNPYASGYTFTPKAVTITDNTISGITETDPYIPAIGVFKGNIDGLTISNNKLSKISNGKAIGHTKGCTNVTVSANTLDDQNYIAITY